MRRQKRKKRNDRNVLEHREVASWVVLCAMLFFSSLAFSVLESGHKPRPLIVSLILPYVYILLLGVGFLVMTANAMLYWRDRSRIGGMSISERLRPQPYTCKWLVAFLP